MPQAPDWLRAKFPNGMQEALNVLDEHFFNYKGMIYQRVPGHVPTDREDDAIDYLVFEWDYSYDPNWQPQEGS